MYGREKPWGEQIRYCLSGKISAYYITCGSHVKVPMAEQLRYPGKDGKDLGRQARFIQRLPPANVVWQNVLRRFVMSETRTKGSEMKK